ncbi:hypothetical protein ABW19_dt0205056 [Dactylella cylindrospora]|nr:hypothetical protein ABW19_dt0205056 [Dactylella cylindrospora]
MTGLTPSNDEYYPTVVINSLMNMLKDQSLSTQHSAVIDAIMNIFKTLGLKCVPFLGQIIPGFITVIRTSQPSKLESYFNQLSILVSIVKQHIRNFLPDILQLIKEHWQLNTNLQGTILQLVEAIARSLEGEFKVYLAQLLPSMLQVLEADGTARRIPTEKVLHAFLVFGANSEEFGEKFDEVLIPDTHSKKQTVNQQHLKNAWEASQRSTREDWQEWIRRFSVELLKESPSHALRACAGLAGAYYPLAKDLFNAAFVSCWVELYDQYQEELVRSIEHALTSPNIPPEILQILLNLAEFMEHDDKALPIDIRTLGKYAAKCHAFAKALHYKETEFLQEPQTSTIEALIKINNQLQQSDAAIGILRRAQQYNDVPLKESWFEKLQRWEEALKAYQLREIDEPNSFEVTMGKMKCLHALGEWEQLSQLAQEKWTHATHEMQRAIAPLAAGAAWGLAQWDIMDDYIGVMKQLSPDRSFFGAILSLHRNHFEDAASHIEKAREGLDSELSALVGESYSRAYSVIVRVQMLAELEEIITYKKSHDHPERQDTMRRTWMKRLQGCQRNVEVWQRMLKVRALVISPKENMEMWIKFANLCRKSGRVGLAEKSLNSLYDVEDGALLVPTDPRVPPQVTYARLKYLWSVGNQSEALSNLIEFTERMSKQIGTNASDAASHSQSQPNSTPALASGHSNRTLEDYSHLLARCYLKQGEWQVALNRSWYLGNVQDVLRSYWLATHFNKDWYKAWHAWALANFEVVTNRDLREVSSSPEMLNNHVVPAVRGFFKSISLSAGSSLQDTLRLLTLWFAHGGHTQVNTAINEGFSIVSIDTWLAVIPQLIARINQPDPVVRRSIHQLLGDVGRAHPQALVFPLTVASKSSHPRRQKSAVSLIENVKTHSAVLVDQAALVSQELIRVAVLWHEQWHEGLEEASRLYFGDHNIDAMFATLEPLHEMLEKGPETLREISFHQAFGRDLHDARDWCNTFKRTGDVGDLNQAWDLYYQVFRKITKQLPQLNSLDLQYVSPRLLNARDLELSVPGIYQSGRPIIKIVSFEPIFTVISSKQRPRKLSIKGSDGNMYQYGLKGHEDLRQDERVMQLFGLVNTLLSVDSECFKRHLNIQRYPIIPLSQNSGLMGWVPQSDTLHVLIREYRESRKILLNIEHRIMLQMAPDYDNLTLMQKVEVFGYALDNTTGQDLYRVLWLKSKSSEAWLDRRTNYTRSLGVMSMVGYILGLGDRHPSNLMLDRITGKVVHIDFGDCFEVAMHREKYPEKVPFRLTRMLTYAMEVSNIEGSFRITCEAVMRVLRDNKESLMAVLEAFMHDPLMHWRLGNRESPADSAASAGPSQASGTETPQLRVARSQSEASTNGLNGYTVEAGAPVDDQTQNARALAVLNRVKDKLTGHDFRPTEELAVADQVDKLLQQATSTCANYMLGGVPFGKINGAPGFLLHYQLNRPSVF